MHFSVDPLQTLVQAKWILLLQIISNHMLVLLLPYHVIGLVLSVVISKSDYNIHAKIS